MKTFRSGLLALTLAALGVGYAPTLLAENDQSSPPQSSTPSEQSPGAYSDRELQSFAVALLEVERIKSSYAPKLAENLRQQAQVKQAASQELLQALKSQGMSVDKYQEMLSNVQSNPQMADKVNEYMKQSANDKGKGQDKGSGGNATPNSPKSGGDSDQSNRVEEL